ncbi:MAG: 16S rRNA (guanine(527)-N(7))-methyltransferase RsmG [Paramuribaculum sp.]|nr:16S rRNA (guanine(527)-N(7))-methyltransferase RsmG [Paramuribaculum sp.]
MDEILNYFPELSLNQIHQFELLSELYNSWNEKINVISRKDISNLYVHHVLHSLAIAKFFEPTDGTTFLDLGTGGGFPGIPLAIMWPNCKFHLIDRIAKKIRVASEIANSINLTNVSFQHGDVGECKQKFDFTVSRAVMPLDKLIKCVIKNISRNQFNSIPNGLICLKGGELEGEIQEIHHPFMEINISDYFSEEYFSTKKIIYVQLS